MLRKDQDTVNITFEARHKDVKKSIAVGIQNLLEERKLLDKIDEKLLNLLDHDAIFHTEHPNQVRSSYKCNENQWMIQFITKNIDELCKNLECPICFVTAKVPIFQCREGHLICFICQHKVNKCSECRNVYSRPLKRHRHAERDVEKLEELIQKVIDLGGKIEAGVEKNNVGEEGSHNNVDSGAKSTAIDCGENMIWNNQNVENEVAQKIHAGGQKMTYGAQKMKINEQVRC